MDFEHIVEKNTEYNQSILQNGVSQNDELVVGFDASNLYKFLQFSRLFPEILDAARLKSLSLTWSHYRSLLRVDNKGARDWYLKEAASQMWSTRTLDCNIASQYYFRLLKSQDKQAVEDEMKQKTKSFQNDKLEFVKNPVVAEFLGLSPNSSFVETELESAIISNLQQFLLELGKGFSFVARQKLVRTEKRNYYIDLVFYNYILKCFVLFDLKTDTMLYMPSEEELRNEIEQQKEVFRLQHLDN